MSILSQRIKAARESKGFKQTDVNKHVGAGSSYCSQLETGIHQGGKHLQKVCEFLGLNFNEIQALKKRNKRVVKLKSKPVKSTAKKTKARTTTLPLSAKKSTFESQLAADILTLVQQRVDHRMSNFWA